ncbi:uncharacterized protein MG039 homolog [Aplysia californica]|uniref:Uncharacterized protein MG039 homolog n=1 Tax=Aplysia californica TaxID=6500 RepID=A0ABM1AAC1_APLCA|nr:uncharacterized protein MG039 homolog [Aplysia californica]
MLHTGFDAPLYSLEMRCIKECQKSIFQLIDKFSIPLRKCGTVLVAWTEQDKQKIPLIQQKSQQAELGEDISEVTASSLYKLEPALASGALGALHVPGECVVDSWLLGISYLHHAQMQGAKVLTNCRVISVTDGLLHTTRGVVQAKVTMNCAGLYGDLVDKLVDINTFRILPRKGQYCVFDKSASPLFNSIIFPVPSEKSKGVAVFRSVYDNVIAGPTAEEVEGRSRPDFSPATHSMLSTHAKNVIPQLEDLMPIGNFTGVRPATEYKDYQIRSYPDKKWISVSGIRSTGVSASLGIAQYLSEKLTDDMGVLPSTGDNVTLLDIDWKISENGQSVIFDDKYIYQASHPLFVYGHQRMESKL